MEGELKSVGTVAALNGKSATVEFTRSKACGDCHACVSFGGNMARTEIENTLGAKVGDRVVIRLHSGSVFAASFIMYGIPLLALVAGVLLGSLISDVFAAVIGIAAAVLALIGIRLFEPKFKRMGKFEPRMIALADPETDVTEPEEKTE